VTLTISEAVIRGLLTTEAGVSPIGICDRQRDTGTGFCSSISGSPPPPPISSIIPSVTHTRFQSLILLCPKDTWAKRNAWSDVGEGALEKFLQIARDFDCIKQCAQGLKTHRACMCRDAHGYRWVVSIERRHRFWALHGTLCVLG